MNLDEHLVDLDGRLLHLSDLDHVGWAVPGLHRCPHTGTVATITHRTATSLIRKRSVIITGDQGVASDP